MSNRRIILIAAVAQNNVIGKRGVTPWHIPEELALFKKLTMGHTLLVGKNTYESIGHALPGRAMVILSTTLSSQAANGSIVCRSIPEALERTKNESMLFVIGGAQVYAQMMPLADELAISHLDQAYEGDAVFPPIDQHIWKITETQSFPLFTHNRYVRI